MGATMLTRRVELRSPVPPDHQVTPYPTHLPAPQRTRRGGTDFSFVQNKVLAVQVTDAICWTGEEARSNSLPNRDSQKKV
jgi:hypothetical protein